ncbi:uncharacterized protein LOC110617606 [Manihot esculenta]|uniref:Uncharacterized protein n=1 Tax=Manihot esculenta TaxID=3983 RepID=A0A2C9VT93_MANES|nr:uncharacterized protein LOC110617606 [Manihot esculenta]OAY48685.1 hypothetical protein MANES_06G177200v8 [Manihot esculenta]
MAEMRNGRVSPSSSPPTPPSPLPISTGPGNQKYSFSPSPSPSPPFSLPPSSHTSTENLPFLPDKLATAAKVASAFSLDLQHPRQMDSRSSCLQDLLEWFLQKCCNCCSKFL